MQLFLRMDMRMYVTAECRHSALSSVGDPTVPEKKLKKSTWESTDVAMGDAKMKAHCFS